MAERQYSNGRATLMSHRDITPVYQSAHEIWSASFTKSKDIIGAKFKKGHVTQTTPISG